MKSSLFFQNWRSLKPAFLPGVLLINRSIEQNDRSTGNFPIYYYIRKFYSLVNSDSVSGCYSQGSYFHVLQDWSCNFNFSSGGALFQFKHYIVGGAFKKKQNGVHGWMLTI